MKTRPRLMQVLFLLALLSLLLAACSAAPATAPTGADAPAAGEAAAKPAGKLVIWMQKANQDVFEKVLAEQFKAEYPDIELEFVNSGVDEIAQKLALALSSGAGAPDIATIETKDVSRMVSMGGLADLSAWVQPFDGQINKSSLSQGMADGAYYSMPWDIGPSMLFYRRDIFEAAGLPSEPAEVEKLVATWDEFLGVCKTIKEKTGNPCFSQNKANNYGWLFETMLWQQGLGYFDGDTVKMDSPEAVATLEKLAEFWAADVTSENLEWTDPWYAEINAPLDDPNVKPAATIPIAAWMGNFLKTWIAPDRAGNWGVVRLPAFTADGVRSANQGGSSFVVPDSSQNKDAAWAFIDAMVGNRDNQVKVFEYSDYFPALETTYDDPLFAAADDYFGGQVTRSLYAEVAKEIPLVGIYGPYYSAMHAAAGTAIQKVGLGQASPADALAEAAAQIRQETGLK